MIFHELFICFAVAFTKWRAVHWDFFMPLTFDESLQPLLIIAARYAQESYSSLTEFRMPLGS